MENRHSLAYHKHTDNPKIKKRRPSVSNQVLKKQKTTSAMAMITWLLLPKVVDQFLEIYPRELRQMAERHVLAVGGKPVVLTYI